MTTNQSIDLLITAEVKKRKAAEIYRIIISALLLIIILLLLLLSCHCRCTFDNDSKHGIPWDSNVTYDDDSYKTDIDALNQKVADGMITISMNADPVFENGTSKGNLQIENDLSNTRPQMIEIYLKDSNGDIDKSRLVYRSGKIPVGGKIQAVALDESLPKGDYQAWAGFHAISDDDEIIGTAGADITLHILN